MATPQGNARSTPDKIPHPRPIAPTGISRNMVDPDPLSALGMPTSNGLGTQMPYHSSAEQNQVSYGTMGSQHTMLNPNLIGYRALDGIGAQFNGHQPLQDGEKPTNNIMSNAGQHHSHPVSVPRSEMPPGVVQDPRYATSGPLTRFLLETATQQPPFLVDRSNGQPSSRGEYWHRSSTSKK